MNTCCKKRGPCTLSSRVFAFSLPPSSRPAGAGLTLLILLLGLAACQPGGASPPTTSPAPLATVQVPPGYQGLIAVTFTPATTYTQALTILQNAGLSLPTPCTKVPPDPPIATPLPISDQQGSFAQNHRLVALGKPTLTSGMLTQSASDPHVVLVTTLPKIVCPL